MNMFIGSKIIPKTDYDTDEIMVDNEYASPVKAEQKEMETELENSESDDQDFFDIDEENDEPEISNLLNSKKEEDDVDVRDEFLVSIKKNQTFVSSDPEENKNEAVELKEEE